MTAGQEITLRRTIKEAAKTLFRYYKRVLKHAIVVKQDRGY